MRAGTSPFCATHAACAGSAFQAIFEWVFALPVAVPGDSFHSSEGGSGAGNLGTSAYHLDFVEAPDEGMPSEVQQTLARAV